MKKLLDHIIKRTLMAEQDAPAGDAAATPLETDNAPSDAKDSPFTPAEERFLGKFDAYGSKHLGILYSTSDAGVREFIARSGKELNISPGILRSLFRKKIIKFVPYTGFGRNDDYTIELQLSLDDVKGLGKADQGKAETGAQASGAAPAGGGAPPPPPENAGVIRTGNVISESLNEDVIPSETELSKAIDFWDYISDSLQSYEWDEDLFYKAFADIVTSKKQALTIDAVGIILYHAFDKSDKKYQHILNTIIKSWTSITNFPIDVKGSTIYTLAKLLNNSQIAKFILDEDDQRKALQSLLNSNGIGRLVYDSASQTSKFYPTYSNEETWKIINSWTKKIPTANKADISKKAESETTSWQTDEKNFSQYFMTQRRKDHKYNKSEQTFKKIKEIKYSNKIIPVTYGGAWVDGSTKKYWVWYKSGDKKIRLFKDGSAKVIIGTASELVNWKFNTPTQIILEK